VADDEQLQPETSSTEVADLFARVPEEQIRSNRRRKAYAAEHVRAESDPTALRAPEQRAAARARAMARSSRRRGRDPCGLHRDWSPGA